MASLRDLITGGPASNAGLAAQVRKTLAYQDAQREAEARGEPLRDYGSDRLPSQFPTTYQRYLMRSPMGTADTAGLDRPDIDPVEIVAGGVGGGGARTAYGIGKGILKGSARDVIRAMVRGGMPGTGPLQTPTHVPWIEATNEYPGSATIEGGPGAARQPGERATLRWNVSRNPRDDRVIHVDYMQRPNEAVIVPPDVQRQVGGEFRDYLAKEGARGVEFYPIGTNANYGGDVRTAGNSWQARLRANEIGLSEPGQPRQRGVPTNPYRPGSEDTTRYRMDPDTGRREPTGGDFYIPLHPHTMARGTAARAADPDFQSAFETPARTPRRTRTLPPEQQRSLAQDRAFDAFNDRGAIGNAVRHTGLTQEQVADYLQQVDPHGVRDPQALLTEYLASQGAGPSIAATVRRPPPNPARQEAARQAAVARREAADVAYQRARAQRGWSTREGFPAVERRVEERQGARMAEDEMRAQRRAEREAGQQSLFQNRLGREEVTGRARTREPIEPVGGDDPLRHQREVEAYRNYYGRNPAGPNDLADFVSRQPPSTIAAAHGLTVAQQQAINHALRRLDPND